MAETKKSKISPYDEELLKAVKTVCSYKLACEANIVAICYKNSDTLFNYELKLEDFSATYSERTFSRIASNYQMLKLIGKDIRIQKIFLGGK